MTETLFDYRVVKQAIAEEWCNGCHQPRRLWGPICPGMTQGDYTHYHSQEWWKARTDSRTPALQRMTMEELEEAVEDWVQNG